MAEVALTADGERALKEAENFCWRTNVAIIGPEHVLAGALLVLSQANVEGVPDAGAIEAAVLASQGMADEDLTANVMFGSSARAAINFTAAGLRAAGRSDITALALAIGTTESGEVNPSFFDALGTTRPELLAALVPP